MEKTVADEELKALWGMASKMVDWINFGWQFYMAVTGVVIGWLFSGSRSLTLPQKIVVSAIFGVVYLLSAVVLYTTCRALHLTILECEAVAEDIKTHNAKFKKLFQDHSDVRYWYAGFVVHFVWIVICFVCVWGIVKTT